MDIQNIKLKLGLSNTDHEQDALLGVLLSNAMSYMKVYIETDEIPKELEFIAEEVAIKRYRRIGSEGISTEKIDVLSTSYKSDDFYEYKPLMKLYKNNKVKVKKLRTL